MSGIQLLVLWLAVQLPITGAALWGSNSFPHFVQRWLVDNLLVVYITVMVKVLEYVILNWETWA